MFESPYESTVCPRSVISRAPCSTAWVASRRICSGSRETSRPRANGTMQYVQNLSQPVETGMHTCDVDAWDGLMWK